MNTKKSKDLQMFKRFLDVTEMKGSLKGKNFQKGKDGPRKP